LVLKILFFLFLTGKMEVPFEQLEYTLAVQATTREVCTAKKYVNLQNVLLAISRSVMRLGIL
jgi:hypothetical protein